jgi:hypothetical protein
MEQYKQGARLCERTWALRFHLPTLARVSSHQRENLWTAFLHCSLSVSPFGREDQLYDPVVTLIPEGSMAQ